MGESFYNTTREGGARLEDYERRAATQEELVIEHFRRRPGLAYSPSQVRNALNLTGVPLTSIRRAITTLTKKRLLERVDKKVDGEYGRPEHCWRLRPPAPEDQLELLPVPEFLR